MNDYITEQQVYAILQDALGKYEDQCPPAIGGDITTVQDHFIAANNLSRTLGNLYQQLYRQQHLLDVKG
jgi:hypothetical protein